MLDEWLVAAPAVLTAVALFVVPGTIVRLAGWNARSLTPYLLAPAISTALIAVSANLAHFLHLPWSVWIVVALTAITAAVAYALRRWVGRDEVPRPPLRSIIAVVGGLILASAVILTQLAYVFVGPDAISQTFDNIVHLNAIRLALDSADASAWTIGSTSDIGFYPNGWHSIVTLVAQLTGVSVPTAVNTTNMAIGAIAWPASTMALAAVQFRERTGALIASAALSTGFGAFPILLLYFGVLYPNTMAYAILPAGLAATLLLARAAHARERVRAAVLLTVICAGIGLSHPNAILALYALGATAVTWMLLQSATAVNTRRAWLRSGGIILALLVVGALMWRFARTGAAMSQWGAWQTTAQAYGEAALIAPRGFPITVVTALLLLIGTAAVVAHPRRNLVVGIPFAVAAFLFILVSGLPAGTVIRDAFTNPWYNDPYRLAALLPIAGISVATLGALAVVDTATSLGRRAAQGRTVPRPLVTLIAAVAALALFSVGAGENVTATAQTARKNYTINDSSALLSLDERTLLDRLDEKTPADALIVVNPWTGGSLAYPLAGRQVVERHVFGIRTDDEAYIDASLADIDSDPKVCSALDRIGATYVLDFGDRNVFSNPKSGVEHDGLNNLPTSRHFVVVDSEGDARLLRIEGC